MAKHNITGAVGEKIAARFLQEKGFEIVSKNFRRPYGEIDIVSREKSGKYRFIEVKTVSWETGTNAGNSTQGIYRPEDNVHPQKIKRLMRVIEAYILSNNLDAEWQFDVIAVYLDQKDKKARVRHLENVILGT